MTPLGIYVHIPFCVKKCNYCDFCSAAASDDIKARYVRALKKELSDTRSREYLSKHEVTSIFFGGGTPTCLSSSSLLDILNTIISCYSVSDDAEITFECNPGTVNYDDLASLLRGGFNRMSLGLQSTNAEELRALGRIHGIRSFDETFNNARRVGFSNINLDLMYGIPFQTERSFEKSLSDVIEYAPEHISAYSLKIEPGTPFFKKREELILPDEDTEYNMYMAAISTLGSVGYRHYEISNYAKNGCESHHNLKYWKCEDYAGFGISAHSCIGSNRYFITDSLEEYLVFHERSLGNAVCVEEELTLSEFADEYVMMRMRLADGLVFDELEKRFGENFKKNYFDRMMPYIKSGHIIFDEIGGKVRFTDKSMYVSNYILSDILYLDA